MVVKKGVDGQKLNRSNAKTFDVIHDRPLGQAVECAALLMRYGGMQPREARNMRLIKNRAVPGNPWLCGRFPIRCNVTYAAFRHERGTVCLGEGQILVVL